MSAATTLRRAKMICLDENFKPVIQHDILAPTVEVTSIDSGVHTFTCLLCNKTERRSVAAEIILTDDVAFGGGATNG